VSLVKNISRRQLVKSGGFGLAATTAMFPKPAIAQGTRELRMVTTWPKGLTGFGKSAERVAREIGALSGGRIQVRVYAANEMVGAFESFDAVASGLADMYHGAEYYWERRSPAFNYFAAVPFGLTAAEMSAWVYFGGGQALWDALSAEFGLKPFMCGNTGAQMGGWFTKEVTSVQSFKGLRYRMPGLGGEVLRRLGAAAVSLPGGEIIPALRSGAIDASEWVGPSDDMALGLHKVAPFYYYPGFHEPGTALSLVVNKKLWDSLKATERSFIETAAVAENSKMLSEYNANNAAAVEILAEDPEVKIRKFDDTIVQSLHKVTGEVLADTSRIDGTTRRVHDSFMNFRAAAVRWADISERAYLNARALPLPTAQ
jgi:TRAP-type mannitol/chloroaromatic compound transport system substrate-binding protein